jgi:hypothetical protein
MIALIAMGVDHATMESASRRRAEAALWRAHGGGRVGALNDASRTASGFG